MIGKRALATLLSLIVVGPAAAGLVRASSATGCAVDPTDAGRAPQAIGAVAAGKVVMVGTGGSRAPYAYGVAGGSVARHVATLPGRGVAFVEDRKGPDAVVRVGPKGVHRVQESGEVTHPAWSPSGDLVYAVGMAAVRLLRADGARVTLPGPEGARAVFSPLFDSEGRLLVVGSLPVAGYQGSDDSLNDLFRRDPQTGSWTRLTSFSADAERWSVIRTPVLDDDGSFLFVRMVGSASGVPAPRSELWRLDAAGARKVRDLNGEMYLAGAVGSAVLWNAFAAGEWRLYLEGPAGMQDLGCGAVQVDPRNEGDPDLAPDEDPAPLAGREEAPERTAEGALAVKVGDFATRGGARDVALALGLLQARVIDAESAPGAVAPGVYAVAVPLAPEADPVVALEQFRRRFPGHAGRTWIVAL